MYLELAELTTIITLISVSTERVVEILKPVLPQFNEKYNTAIYSIIAFSVSLTIYKLNGFNMVFINENNLWAQAVIVGLACSACSGFWNNVLSAIQTFKIKNLK